MIMKWLVWILPLAFFGASFQVLAVDSNSAAPTKDEAYEVLLKANTFGFGHKIGQKERATDTAFQQIRAHPDRNQLFRTLFRKGKTPAKLYALVGLCNSDKQTFEEFAKSMDSNEIVHTQFGCVVGEIRVAEILTAIQKGTYDSWVPSPLSITEDQLKEFLKRVPTSSANPNGIIYSGMDLFKAGALLPENYQRLLQPYKTQADAKEATYTFLDISGSQGRYHAKLRVAVETRTIIQFSSFGRKYPNPQSTEK